MNLQELFESLRLSDLEEWVRTRRQEDLHLDFKLLTSSPEFKPEDKRNLATALSGFANSDGGLIVWGVDCRKGVDGVDGARELVPLKNVERVLSRLQSLTGDAVVPRLVNVRHRVIGERNGDSGFIVTLVCFSDAGPHMAKLGEDRYYKRSGESFYKMEHFDIAGMFGRRPTPSLNLALLATTGGTESNMGVRSAWAQASVRVVNSGRGLAKFPFLRIRVSQPYRIADSGLDGNGQSGLPMPIQSTQDEGWRAYAGGTNHIVHPGSYLDVTFVKTKVTEHSSILEDLLVEYTVTAEGQLEISGKASLSGAELLRLAKDQIARSYPR